MSNDRNRGDDAELDVGHECSRDEDPINKVMKGVPQHDKHSATTMIMRIVSGFAFAEEWVVDLALVDMTVPPQDQLF